MHPFGDSSKTISFLAGIVLFIGLGFLYCIVWVKPINEEKLINALESFINSFDNSKICTLASQWLFDEGRSTIKGPLEEFILTKKECAFLKLLLKKHRIISYEEIENLIWSQENVMTPNALRLFIKNFRKKLPNDVLKNVQGIGYQLLI